MSMDKTVLACLDEASGCLVVPPNCASRESRFKLMRGSSCRRRTVMQYKSLPPESILKIEDKTKGWSDDQQPWTTQML